MPFRVPTFNLTVNIWHNGTGVANDPDVVTAGNLSPGNRSGLTLNSLGGGVLATANLAISLAETMFLALPGLTDIRGWGQDGLAGGDNVEIPAGTGRFYAVLGVDDVAKGFANEYRRATLCPITGPLVASTLNTNGITGPWPLPLP